MKGFIDSKNIPEDEIVIMGGDMNVDLKCEEKASQDEYKSMLKILNAKDTALAPDADGHTLEYSFDAENNVFASGGPSSGGFSERLDYVLSSSSHLQPNESYAKIIPLKHNEHLGKLRDARKEQEAEMKKETTTVFRTFRGSRGRQNILSKGRNRAYIQSTKGTSPGSDAGSPSNSGSTPSKTQDDGEGSGKSPKSGTDTTESRDRLPSARMSEAMDDHDDYGSEDLANAKDLSDHYPIYAHFEY